MGSRPPVIEHGAPVGWPQLSLYLAVSDPDSHSFYSDVPDGYHWTFTGHVAEFDPENIPQRP